MSSDTSCQTIIQNGRAMKDSIKDYATDVGAIIFPEYKKFLDEIGEDLDRFYQGHAWYNKKEKHIMMYDSLDDALMYLKMDLWARYNSSHISHGGRMMPFCHANNQHCNIENPSPKSCIECIYIKHYGANDLDDLYRGIRKLFDSSNGSVINE